MYLDLHSLLHIFTNLQNVYKWMSLVFLKTSSFSWAHLKMLLTLLKKVTKLCKSCPLIYCLPAFFLRLKSVHNFVHCSLNDYLQSYTFFSKLFFSLTNSGLSNPPHSCFPLLLRRWMMLFVLRLLSLTFHPHLAMLIIVIFSKLFFGIFHSTAFL